MPQEKCSKPECMGEGSLKKNSGPLHDCILEKDLPANLQAAQEFGIRINVLKTGETYALSENRTALTVGVGEVGIIYQKEPINQNGPVYDYSNFGRRVDELKKTTLLKPQTQAQEKDEHLPCPYQHISLSDNSAILIIRKSWEPFLKTAAEITNSEIKIIANEKYEERYGVKITKGKIVVDMINRFKPLDLLEIFNKAKELETLDVRK